jgi:protein gp37
MGADSKIEWTDHTFNPWFGCQHVSPGCDHCYAETQNAYRKWTADGDWGPHAERTRAADSTWRNPLRWAKAAKGTRPRVFCASLADWLDNKVPRQWRTDLAALIAATPQLDWLLLTKRIEIFDQLAPWPRSAVPSNCWIGVTCENQEYFDRRYPLLHDIKAIRFISYEPALGSADLGQSAPGLDHLRR